MKPDLIAQHHPEKPAAIMSNSGTVLDFKTLSERSTRIAQAMTQAGLRPRDHIALMLENRLEFFEVCWAALRMGLYYTPVNWHLQADEVGHILQDSGARWLFVSAALAPIAAARFLPSLERTVIIDDDGSQSYAALLACAPVNQPVDEREGQAMYYSSGTTGQPKGIKRSLAFPLFGTTPAWEPLLTDGSLRSTRGFALD